MCTSVDLASAEKEESSDPDFNVILTTAVEPQSGLVTVVEYTRERMNPSDTIDCIFQHHMRHHPVKILVEAIGYQRVLVHYIKRRQKRNGIQFVIEPITSHKQSKVDRIRGLQPYFYGGLVHIRPGMVELEQELLAFPKGAHDDVVDALSMQVSFWVEMTEMVRQVAPIKEEDFMSGASVIKELKTRISAINRYPYDGGNLDDHYLNDIIRSDVLRQEIMERAEEHRRMALIA
jgi:predicted phage terminase large subunit-like protein